MFVAVISPSAFKIIFIGWKPSGETRDRDHNFTFVLVRDKLMAIYKRENTSGILLLQILN